MGFIRLTRNPLTTHPLITRPTRFARSNGVIESKRVDSNNRADLGARDVAAPENENGEVIVERYVEEDDEEELGEEDDIDEDEEDGEEGMEGGRVFSVGEFVWGKIKHHPWWPGQIYDASDASELALKHKPKDKDSYLVAYFGDGTFSWCFASQLKSFDENFEALSQQSNLKSFQYAVEDALSVIGELVVLEMTCACVGKDGQVGFVRPVAENAGVKKGVLVPMIGVDRLAAARFDAESILSAVRNAARSVSVKNGLELTMLSSKLLAFYRAKGFSELPKYHFPVYIAGLEDISKSNVAAEVDGLDSNGQTPSANPSEKAPALQEDKLYGRRKRKSLADIIREETDADVQHDKEDKKTPVSRQGARKTKRVGLNGLEKGSQSPRAKGSKKVKASQKTDSVGKTETSGVDIDDNDQWQNAKKDVAVRSKGRKRTDTTSGEKDAAVKSREKKRREDSTSPFASVKQVGFEPMLLDLHTDARVGERMSKAAKLIIESPSIKKSRNISSDDETSQKCIIKNEEALLSDDQAKTQIGGGGCMDPKAKLNVIPWNKVYDSLIDEDDDDDGRPMSAILIITFSDLLHFPSKADLIAKYSQFGTLNEKETNVFPEALFAQVFFIKKSDGEQAFEDTVKMNSIISGVQYKIRYVPRGELDGNMRPKISTLSDKVDNDVQPASVSYLKRRFDILMSKLNEVNGDSVSNELKNELRNELTSLLEKLS